MGMKAMWTRKKAKSHCRTYSGWTISQLDYLINRASDDVYWYWRGYID
jgi:hypothetical protein